MMIQKSTAIEYEGMRFLIMAVPNSTKLYLFLRQMKAQNVKILIRTCQSFYDDKIIENEGIQVVDLQFDDGDYVSETIIIKWLKIVKQFFLNKKSAEEAKESMAQNPPTIAVHCLAGLGRAPLLIAIALIEKGQKNNQEVIELIREKRKGALNSAQLKFLQDYKPKGFFNKPSQSCGCNVF